MEASICVSKSESQTLIQFGLAAATLEKVRREAGQKLEGGRKFGLPVAQHDILPTLQNLHVLRAKTKLLGNSHGLAIFAAKNLGNGHERDIYQLYGRRKCPEMMERSRSSGRPTKLELSRFQMVVLFTVEYFRENQFHPQPRIAPDRRMTRASPINPFQT